MNRKPPCLPENGALSAGAPPEPPNAAEMREPPAPAPQASASEAQGALLYHPFPPIYDARSRVLILGSFPSVRSREAAFFYAHPQNRFWPVLAAVLGEETPKTVAEKTALLLRRRIALWDVAACCTITGSADASMRQVRANDLSPILCGADIRAIFCNGGTAYRLYRRLCLPHTGREAALLPSTSPANARCSLPQLVTLWAGALTPVLSGA